MKKTIASIGLAAMILTFAPVASADVIWTLDDVTLSDGATVTGNFIVNPALDYVAWAIEVTGGPSVLDFYYNPSDSLVNTTYSTTSNLDIQTHPYASFIDLTFSSPLTNILVPTSIPLVGNGSYITASDTSTCGGSPIAVCADMISSGSIEADPAPEPATLGLLGTGLFVLAASVRKRVKSRSTRDPRSA